MRGGAVSGGNLHMGVTPEQKSPYGPAEGGPKKIGELGGGSGIARAASGAPEVSFFRAPAARVGPERPSTSLTPAQKTPLLWSWALALS